MPFTISTSEWLYVVLCRRRMLSDLAVLRERLDRIEETERRKLDTRMCRRCVRPYRQTPLADRDRCESCGETHAGSMRSLRQSHAPPKT